MIISPSFKIVIDKTIDDKMGNTLFFKSNYVVLHFNLLNKLIICFVVSHEFGYQSVVSMISSKGCNKPIIFNFIIYLQINVGLLLQEKYKIKQITI